MTTPTAKQITDYELATSYRRVVARLIDLGVGFFVLLMISGMIAELIRMLFKLDQDAFTTLFMVVWFLLLIVYDIVMHRLLGKTLGKMLLGLRVVDVKGDKLSWGMCILRVVLVYILAIGIVFLTAVTASIFGWIFIGSLGRYRRFPHDSATRSFVVREIKGQLVKSTASASVSPGKPTPLADLERLYEQGIISKEELERKKKEIGVR
jgi:uncharacterized RDD family membrane protein YckC